MALTNAYVTLAQIKAWAGGISDTLDDDLLELAANAASRRIDTYTNRRFYLDEAASARVFRATQDGDLWVDDIGNATITVKTDLGDDGTFETTWASTDFEVWPFDAIGQGKPIMRLSAVESNRYPFSGYRSGVQVTARWGWPSVPDDVVMACLILSTRLFKRKDSPEGSMGFAEFGALRLSRMDPDVAELLGPYRLLVVG